MNRFKLIALTVPMALSSAAFAADSASTGSQFEHQAASGKIEVTPGLTYGSIKTNYNAQYNNGGFTSSTDSLFNIGVAGEYGINDMISVGLRLAYQSDSTSLSPDPGVGKISSSGLTDPSIYENTKMDLGPGSLHFGGNLTFSIGNGTYDYTNGSAKQSEQDGAIILTPYVGYEANVGPGTVGGRLSYDVLKGNRTFNDKSAKANKDTVVKGGNMLTLAAFWEMNFQPVLWGVDLGIHNMSGTKASVEGGADADSHNGQTNFFAETYATWEFMPDMTLLPTIGYGQMGGTVLTGGSSSESGIYLTVAARFAF